MAKGKKMFFGFDCENDGKRLTLGSIVGDGFEYVFYSAEEFVSLIHDRMFRNCIIFATNLEYDLGVIFNTDKEFEKRCNVLRRGGRVISARYQVGRNCVTFADTLNFCMAGVKALGKVIGMEKMESPRSWSPNDSEEWRYLREYNLQDSLITYRFMEHLRDGFEMLGSDLKITISSTAMNYWKRSTGHEKIEHSVFMDEEQAAYFGGRTEVFKRGFFENVKIYDFNSMYPAAMKGLQIPIASTARRCFDPELKEEGISYVKVKCPYMKIPFLPVRQDKLIFPVGEWEGWYTHIELRKARSIGYDIKVVKSITYDTEDMFSAYVDKFYALKKRYKEEGNHIMTIISKLMLNSLYGKFATKLEVENAVHKDMIPAWKLIELLEDGNKICGDFVHYKDEMKYIPGYVQPVVSAYIAGKARIMLYEAFELVGFENVLYCDTDSVFTTIDIPTSKELGGLEKEYDGDIILVRPKCYCPLGEGKQLKVKGLGRVIKDKNDFFRYILGEEEVKFKRLSRIKESRRRGFYYGQEIDCFKKLSLEDDKRVWRDKFDRNSGQDSVPKTII